ncbi:MAG TPA: hypothetical protein VF585_09535 [Chthoniobacterales bacterium]
MLYHPSLFITQLVVGIVLLLAHGAALAAGPSLVAPLKKFPRSKGWGFLLLTISAAWSLWLMITMDLGEFTSKRPMLIALVPIAYLLTLFFVPEFLAVRALGMLGLLVACIVLDAAFLNHDPLRLPLVTLAYVWIVAALFMVGKPYLLRDGIGWVTEKAGRLKLASIGGIVAGAVLIGIALARFRGL